MKFVRVYELRQGARRSGRTIDAWQPAAGGELRHYSGGEPSIQFDHKFKAEGYLVRGDVVKVHVFAPG